MLDGKGLIRRASEVESRSGGEGHSKMLVYSLLRRVKAPTMPGEQGSLYLGIAMNEIEPGGGIDPHYHVDAPVFDHVYYVISGKILGRVGDKEEEVGADSIIYCPSDVLTSIKNIGEDTAKILMLAALPPEGSRGKFVWVDSL